MQSFLRQWNASLHLWLLNYIYKPLGGRQARLRSTFATFLFVAALLGMTPVNLLCALVATAVYNIEQVASRSLTKRDQFYQLIASNERHVTLECKKITLSHFLFSCQQVSMQAAWHGRALLIFCCRYLC